MNIIKSVFIWIFIISVILLWVPVVAVFRLFDRDPAHYMTGFLYRRLGYVITKVIPAYITYSFDPSIKMMREKVVVVSNHQSLGDIPLISTIPFEMKWVAKKALFSVPVVGWMMGWAGDIAVDRKAVNRRKKTLEQAKFYLKHDCPVMFFPEGTRSRNGNLNRFNTGAFDLAIETNSPVLPIALDGTQEYLPKKKWIFGKKGDIKLEVLPMVYPGDKNSDQLTQEVRENIKTKLAEWRSCKPDDVDNLVK